MLTAATPQEIRTLHIQREVEIAAPIEIAFQALLDQIGPANDTPEGGPMPMKLEPWPGGRWYRDLGDNRGHLWAHVQVIKPPTLLELIGPLFMSYAAMSHVQYRFAPQGRGIRLTLIHSAFGTITPEHQEGVYRGWNHGLARIREAAEHRARR